MLGWLKESSRLRRKAEELYGGVVAAARQTGFYGAGRVADTPEGRLEMVALHLFLLAERLNREGKEGEKLAQSLIEAFVTDMDDCMREMGVGDLKVPEQVKHAAAIFYKRSRGYREGVAAALSGAGSLDTLSGYLDDTLMHQGVTSDGANAFSQVLAGYMTGVSKELAGLRFVDIAERDFSLADLAKLQ